MGIVLSERCGEGSGGYTFGRAEEPRHGGFLILSGRVGDGEQEGCVIEVEDLCTKQQMMTGDGVGLLINCCDGDKTAHLGSVDCRSAADREIFGTGLCLHFLRRQNNNNGGILSFPFTFEL